MITRQGSVMERNSFTRSNNTNFVQRSFLSLLFIGSFVLLSASVSVVASRLHFKAMTSPEVSLDVDVVGPKIGDFYQKNIGKSSESRSGL